MDAQVENWQTNKQKNWTNTNFWLTIATTEGYVIVEYTL